MMTNHNILKGDTNMDDIKLLTKGREHDVYSIHYSSNGFYDGGALAPAICCISLVNFSTHELHSFALHNYIFTEKCIVDAQKRLLCEFSEFIKNLNNPIYIHWNMYSLEYGFKALTAGCENFGIYDLSFNEADSYNLADKIEGSLFGAFEDYGYLSPAFLSGKEELACFDKRSYNLVKCSTDAKAIGIMALFKKLMKNEITPEILY